MPCPDKAASQSLKQLPNILTLTGKVERRGHMYEYDGSAPTRTLLLVDLRLENGKPLGKPDHCWLKVNKYLRRLHSKIGQRIKFRARHHQTIKGWQGSIEEHALRLINADWPSPQRYVWNLDQIDHKSVEIVADQIEPIAEPWQITNRF